MEIIRILNVQEKPLLGRRKVAQHFHSNKERFLFIFQLERLFPTHFHDFGDSLSYLKIVV
jgi:hypothetical protein